MKSVAKTVKKTLNEFNVFGHKDYITCYKIQDLHGNISDFVPQDYLDI